MSRRSRSAPGSAQNHSGNDRAMKNKCALQRKRIEDERRAQIHEIGDARRAQVYRTDVEFAPDDAPRVLPVRGSAERATLIDEVLRLRERGMSQLKIGIELNWSQATICNLIREAKTKGEVK